MCACMCDGLFVCVRACVLTWLLGAMTVSLAVGESKNATRLACWMACMRVVSSGVVEIMFQIVRQPPGLGGGGEGGEGGGEVTGGGGGLLYIRRGCGHDTHTCTHIHVIQRADPLPAYACCARCRYTIRSWIVLPRMLQLHCVARSASSNRRCVLLHCMST